MEDLTLLKTIEALAYLLYMVGCCITVLLLTVGLYFVGVEDGEQDLVQQLCERKQYDFCEPIEEHIVKYKLKEIKND